MSAKDKTCRAQPTIRETLEECAVGDCTLVRLTHNAGAMLQMCNPELDRPEAADLETPSDREVIHKPWLFERVRININGSAVHHWKRLE